MKKTLKIALRWILAAGMVVIGVSHFVDPAPFVMIVPPHLPWAYALVLVSGAFEVLGGLGLLVEKTRRFAGWGLIALYLAVFPANIQMALNEIQMFESPLPTWAFWARLPFQFGFIALAYWVSSPNESAA